MKRKGSTSGMTGGFMPKKGPDMAPKPGSYAGLATTPLGGGTERPRRGLEASGIAYNGNCK